jgi:hypothetical protein
VVRVAAIEDLGGSRGVQALVAIIDVDRMEQAVVDSGVWS